LIFFDTETCGLHGMAVLLQWAEDDGPIFLHNFWKVPVQESLDVIRYIVERDVCGFNLAFDWFQLCKIYTVFSMLDPEWIPEEHIEEIALVEPSGRTGPCLKPRSALDLMLHARKGPYQSLMDRKDIRIKRIPTPLAMPLIKELESRIKLDDIYFSRRKDKFAPRWQSYPVIKKNGDEDPDFRDVVLKFAASGSLKTLAIHALGVKEDSVLLFSDVEVERKMFPEELGYAPFALAVG
jgi:hypothetical protein